MKNKKHILDRVIACVMVVLMAITAVPMSGFVGIELPKWSEIFVTKASAAETYTEGIFKYTVSDGEATITGHTSSIRGDLVIPDTIGGYPVTSIGDSAFEGCTGLTSVTIPDSVTSIYGGAFFSCTNLISITIPDSVTYIGSTEVAGDAFENTAWYNAQPYGDVYAGKVYYNYKGTMPENRSIVIKDGTKGIASYAFQDCSGLTSITIPDSVTNIGDAAFDWCNNLTSVKISDLDAWCKISFDGRLSNPLYYANRLYINDNLSTYITIPDSVTSIGDYAFYNCTSLISVTIGSNVTSIGSNAFYWCKNLTSVTIGSNVTSIGNNAFYLCNSLTRVNISDLASWCKISFDSYLSNPLYYAEELYINDNFSTHITIPDSVTSIGDYTFYNYTSLTSVTIGSNVTSIGKSAFYLCTGLTGITISDSVTSIGNSAFYLCTGLTSITIPDSVTSIGHDAFYGCDRLKSITIGNGIETILKHAFSNCPILTTIKIGKNVKTIEQNAFYGIKSIPEVYYAGSEADWKNISIDQSNDMILRANMHYNVDITHTHSYTAKITKKATCTESGVKTFTCDCGKIYTEEIPATGHTSSEWIEDKAATCVNEGEKHKECTVCQTVLENGTISANGHDFESDIIPATCTSIGYETKTCKTCGECHFVRAISANGHTPSDWIVDYDVTCTSDGLRHKECTVCNMIIESETIYAVSHKYRTETTAATCMANGYEIMICADCGETEFVRSIPAKGHTLKTAVTPATQTESGLSITSCKTCGTITKATLIKRIASVSLSKTAFTYNGKVQTPTVTVKDSSGKVLKNGTDYTVKYSSGRKNPGQYTVTVTFKGNYSGTKTLTYTIAPGTPSLSVTAGSKKATLKWNKQTGTTGYVVYMSTSKSGKFSKVATLKGNSKISYTKTGLTKGKTYYFKVQAYTSVGGKTINGAFSAVKSVKVR